MTINSEHTFSIDTFKETTPTKQRQMCLALSDSSRFKSLDLNAINAFCCCVRPHPSSPFWPLPPSTVCCILCHLGASCTECKSWTPQLSPRRATLIARTKPKVIFAPTVDSGSTFTRAAGSQKEWFGVVISSATWLSHWHLLRHQMTTRRVDAAVYIAFLRSKTQRKRTVSSRLCPEFFTGLQFFEKLDFAEACNGKFIECNRCNLLNFSKVHKF